MAIQHTFKVCNHYVTTTIIVVKYCTHNSFTLFLFYFEKGQ